MHCSTTPSTSCEGNEHRVTVRSLSLDFIQRHDSMQYSIHPARNRKPNTAHLPITTTPSPDPQCLITVRPRHLPHPPTSTIPVPLPLQPPQNPLSPNPPPFSRMHRLYPRPRIGITSHIWNFFHSPHPAAVTLSEVLAGVPDAVLAVHAVEFVALAAKPIEACVCVDDGWGGWSGGLVAESQGMGVPGWGSHGLIVFLTMELDGCDGL